MHSSVFRELTRCLDADRLVAVATLIAGPSRGQQLLIAPASADGLPAIRKGGLGTPKIDSVVTERAEELLATFKSQRLSLADGVDVFIEVHPPRPKLVIVGAVHVSTALVTFANTLGFKTIVVDPRTAFATPERFAHADELSTEWPDEALRAIGINENTYVVSLSHDEKLDLPTLEVALPSPARYIGALGSKKTHQKRVLALKERGRSDKEIARIHNPIGLDLGGRRAEEIAVAIMAEMIAVNHGRSQP